jgi:Ca2+-binding EF-hand superfamily protein
VVELLVKECVKEGGINRKDFEMMLKRDDIKDDSALSIASEEGHPAVVEFLVKACKKYGLSETEINDLRRTGAKTGKQQRRNRVYSSLPTSLASINTILPASLVASSTVMPPCVPKGGKILPASLVASSTVMPPCVPKGGQNRSMSILLVATLKYNEISIQEGYVEADVDEDGKVSEQDWVIFCKELQLCPDRFDEESVRAYFKDLDPQGKGFIEFDAWVKALTEAGDTEASRRLVIVSNVVNRMQTAKVRTAFDMWCDYNNDSKWGFETTTLSMFAAIDTDSSGTISVQKLRTFMERENVSVTEKEVSDRFDKMDSQKRGSVSQDEFLEAAKKDGFKATALFAAIDTDNSGKISIEKLRTFMQRKDSLVSEKTLQDCFDQMDSKKMGSVSKEEFVEATIDCPVDSPKQHKSKEKLSSSSSEKSKGKVSSTLAASVKSLEKSQLQELLEKYDLEDDADVLAKNGIKKESDLSYVNESVIKAMQLSPVSVAKLRKLVQDHGARALSPAKTPAGTVARERSSQGVPLSYDFPQSAEKAPLLLSGGGSLAAAEPGELAEALASANDKIVDELRDAIDADVMLMP